MADDLDLADTVRFRRSTAELDTDDHDAFEEWADAAQRLLATSWPGDPRLRLPRRAHDDPG